MKGDGGKKRKENGCQHKRYMHILFVCRWFIRKSLKNRELVYLRFCISLFLHSTSNLLHSKRHTQFGYLDKLRSKFDSFLLLLFAYVKVAYDLQSVASGIAILKKEYYMYGI